MVRVSQTPYHFELKEIQFKLIFCFISINIGVMCAGQSVTNVCSICSCDQYQTKVDCYNRKLTSVPKAIPATVETIDMRLNQITNIEKDAFKYLINLKTLKLGGNKITHIEEDAFKSLVNLEYLSLLDNGITNIPEGAFNNLVNLERLDLSWNKIKNIEEYTFKRLVNLKTLSLMRAGITNISEGAFNNLVNLENLDLRRNKITNIEEYTFKYLVNLKNLSLYGNKITNISERAFRILTNLEALYLINNQIIKYEDGAFLFLPNITYIHLSGNDNMICGCHLPAIVDYIKRTYNRQVTVRGNCRNNHQKSIKILKYSECKNYSLFQRKLQCQTCSGIACKNSEVTSCPGAEPVCMNRISMSGVTLKSDKSCSTYRECVAAKKNNRFPCNKLTSGTSCVTCCTGHLCNKNDFIAATTKEPTEIEARLEKLEKDMTHIVETVDSIQSQLNDVYIHIHGDTTHVSHPQSHMRHTHFHGYRMDTVEAHCDITPNTQLKSAPKVKGHIHIVQQTSEVKVYVTLSVFDADNPKEVFALHIHEFNDTSESCDSLGGHFKPDNHQHRVAEKPHVSRHAGGWGNVVANNNGIIISQFGDKDVSLMGPDSIIGRSIVLKSKADNKGDSGERLACCVISKVNKLKMSYHNKNIGRGRGRQLQDETLSLFSILTQL